MFHRDYELEKMVIERLDGTADMYSLTHPFMEYDSCELDDEYIQHNLLEDVPHLESVNAGVSKLVLIFDDIDQFVIKVPFYCLRDSYDEEECLDFKQDYCVEEAKMYAKAKKAEVGDMLCGTWCIGDVNGVKVYMSERADEEYEYDDDNRSAEYRIYTRSLSRSKMFKFDLDKDTVEDFINDYGGKRVERLLEFISKNNINDLHDGNVMRLGGKLKLVDYSSFNEKLW